MTSRIFRSIVTVAVAVLFCSLLLIMGALYGYANDIQAAQLQDELRIAAAGTEQSGLAFLKTVEAKNFRITWIQSDGKVLYDTHAQSGQMENHLQREEIHTIPQLEQRISDTKSEIAVLEIERSKADNARRRAHTPEEVQAAKDERKAITEKIRPLREKVKRAEKIMEKSPHLYELLQSELDVERQAGARARNKNKEWSR